MGVSSATAGLYEDTVLGDDPALYWQLGEAPGAAVAEDATAYDRDGAYQGGVTLGVAGVPLAETTAAHFDGGASLVVDDDGEDYLLGETRLALEIWAQADEIGTNRGIIGGAVGAGGDVILSVRYDSSGYRGDGTNVIKLGLNTTEGTQEYESASNVQTTDLQHLVINWVSGQGFELYINGVLDTPTYQGDQEFNNGVIFGGSVVDVDTLFIGESAYDGGNWLGVLDEFAFYDDPLSAEEVQTHYLNGIPEPATLALLGLGGLATLLRRRR